MSNIPTELKYTKEDEWIRVDGDSATIGITDYAQDALSDIVYLELPDVGDDVSAEDIFGVVESVKAAADLYAPLSGTITEVNEDLLDTPETVNEDPYDEAWLIKMTISDPSELDGLMDSEAYAEYCAGRE